MHAHSIYKKWLIRLGLSAAGLMLLLGLFNYAIDPLWCFSHPNWFNSYQKPHNERQQKTNYLAYVNTRTYDALLLGNSRTCMINQTDFAGVQAYNYSLAGVTPYEFRDFLDYFKKVAGSPGTVFLGLHFQNSNQQSKADVDPPEYYITKALSPLYRFKMLFTKDTLTYSWGNLQIHKEIRKKRSSGNVYYYDHNNVATLFMGNEALRQNSITTEVAKLRTTYRDSYTYREDLAQSLTDLMLANSGTRFIPFTTPVSKPYFCAMVLEGKLPQYERWLKEMVEVFGQMWHFEYLNSITLNYDKNFSDSHHFFNPVGTMIAHRITGVADAAIPSDFGMLLTKGTIDEQLAKIRADSAVCR